VIDIEDEVVPSSLHHRAEDEDAELDRRGGYRGLGDRALERGLRHARPTVDRGTARPGAARTPR
jgi:hypothetical protein